MTLWFGALLTLYLLTCLIALRWHQWKRQRSKARRDDQIKKNKRANQVQAGIFRMRKRLAEIGRTQSPYPPKTSAGQRPHRCN